MKLPFLTREALDSLESAVELNLPQYRAGQTPGLISPSMARESRIEVEQPPTLVDEKGDVEPDALAARRLFQWLQKLNPAQASDARLWTHLTHTIFAEYVYKRWGSSLHGSAEPERRVVERWFFRGEGSATFFRNALSRLWWFGHITHDAGRGDPFELTDVLLSLQDIQQAFLERSLGRCRPLLQAVLRTYRQAETKGEIGTSRGDTVKRWAVELNKVGGVYLFDALPADRLEFMVKQQLRAAAR